jgi:hypothetical protein
MNNPKPAKKQQWRERSEAPIATRPLEKADMEHFKKILAQSYKLDEKEILFNFEKIKDENDDDEHTHMYLVYKMNVINTVGVLGQPREIFRLKFPVPENVIKKAQEASRAAAAARGEDMPQEDDPRLRFRRRTPRAAEPPLGPAIVPIAPDQLNNPNAPALTPEQITEMIKQRAPTSTQSVLPAEQRSEQLVPNSVDISPPSDDKTNVV